MAGKNFPNAPRILIHCAVQCVLCLSHTSCSVYTSTHHAHTRVHGEGGGRQCSGKNQPPRWSRQGLETGNSKSDRVAALIH